jgi:hypothetical protein
MKQQSVGRQTCCFMITALQAITLTIDPSMSSLLGWNTKPKTVAPL